MKRPGKPGAGDPHAGFDEAGAGDVTMGAGLRPAAKAEDEPPDPTVRAPVLDPTDERGVETEHQPPRHSSTLLYQSMANFHTCSYLNLLILYLFLHLWLLIFHCSCPKPENGYSPR